MPGVWHEHLAGKFYGLKVRGDKSMESYTGFAQVYDLFMDNTPYETWGVFLEGQLKKEGIEKGLILDLGCGTGKMTRILAEKGYDMIGIDLSMEMLEIAQEAERNVSRDILYLCQDMREFELYGTVRAVVCCCDCINYITDEKELEEVFRLVNNYLDPGGIFLFDFNSVYKYETRLGEQTFAENREEGSFIWENYYDRKSQINEYDLTLFIKAGECYQKYEETHFQRAYTLEKIKKLLELGGMEFVAAYDDYTSREAHGSSERICVLARETGKQKRNGEGIVRERKSDAYNE